MNSLHPRQDHGTTSLDLVAMGQRIRQQRRSQGINATAASEAAGISRMTLHRIERGEPSVAIGAYAGVMAALGLAFSAVPAVPAGGLRAAEPNHWIPARIRLSDFPQLRALAWQLKEGAELTPAEALDIYERNERHIDTSKLEPAEQALMDALRIALGRTSDV